MADQWTSRESLIQVRTSRYRSGSSILSKRLDGRRSTITGGCADTLHLTNSPSSRPGKTAKGAVLTR